MNPTPQQMRDTLRFWASGVAIVTTAHGEYQAGMTVSAFNSLSLEPPLVVVCLNKDSTTAKLVSESEVFAVSILGENHAAISDRFAGRIDLPDNAERFVGMPNMTAVTGSPILTDAIAWLDCQVNTRHDGGTHWILVGEVQAAGSNVGIENPLLYYDRDYRTILVKEAQP